MIKKELIFRVMNEFINLEKTEIIVSSNNICNDRRRELSKRLGVKEVE